MTIAHFCATCGAQYPPMQLPPTRCVICQDARQYVPASGQQWVTPDELAGGHSTVIRDEGAYVGVGIEPKFAIGQRALLVDDVLWDCVPLLDDAAAAEIERRDGVAAIAISHPHYYTGMVEWAHRFECPVYLHADDRDWITRHDPAIELWEGESRPLRGALSLIRLGGHFAGGTVLYDARTLALLAGDIVQVIPDRSHVGFMYSYPNLIPLPERTVRGIAATLERYDVHAVYGAWWDAVIPSEGSAIIARSAERYARALRGDLP